MLSRARLHSRYRHRPSHQRGVATLLVVMALFFLVSMVAAYASRNLVFEQRTSANQYRATQAFEVAEGGAEWALSLLNGGRIDTNCASSNDTSLTSFRERYLIIRPDSGRIEPVPPPPPSVRPSLNPTCQRTQVGWECHCPTNGPPVLDDAAGAGITPAFRVEFNRLNKYPGLVRIQSTGCTANAESCLKDGVGSGAEAASRVEVAAALVPSLQSAPAAAITARGTASVNGAMRVVNTDSSSSGIAIHAGDAISGSTAAEPMSASGTPIGQAAVGDDLQLKSLTADRMFRTFFGLSPVRYAAQPPVVTLECSDDCSSSLQEKVAQHPGQPIWIKGDTSLKSDVALGTAQMPLLLIVDGALSVTGGAADITGVVYARGAARWTTATRSVVRGALISEGDFESSTSPLDVAYDSAVINTIRATQGSFVRLPGSWRTP